MQEAAGRAVILHGVAAVADARPDDQDTLNQAEAVAAALTALGWSVEVVALGLDLSALAQRLGVDPPALVFNLVEAVAGHDRLMPVVPALLDSLGLSYTGNRAEAASVTVNKLAAKRVMAAAGIPTPDWVESAAAAEPGRWIVKSVTEHASAGLDPSSVVDHRRVAERVARAEARHGGEWFAERYIAGREFNISLLDGPEGPEVLPMAEIRFIDFPPGRPQIVDYAAKWHEGSVEDLGTVRTFSTAGPELAAKLRAISLRCWQVFGLSGYARVDFRIDHEGAPFVLEVNVNPSIAPDSGFVAAAGQAGMSYAQLIGRIVDAGSRRNTGCPIAA